MYTDAMRRAFHSIVAPKNFGIALEDNDAWITIRLDAKDLFHLSHDDKIEALKYVNKVKDALEQNGAIVLVVRKPIGEENEKYKKY